MTKNLPQSDLSKMLEYVEAPEDGNVLGKLIDDGMRLHPSVLPSKSQFTTQFGTNATPRGRTKGSPSVESSSSCIPSPSVRTIGRMNSSQQEEMYQNNSRSSIPTLSVLGKNVTKISSRDNSYDASLSSASRTLNEGSQTKFPQASPLSNIPIKPALRGIQKSITPVRRRQATSTTIRRHQRLYTTPSTVKPFELLEAMELNLRASSQTSQFSNELRRLKLVINIHHCLNIPRAVLLRAEKPRVLEQPPVPNINELVLEMLSIVEDQASCSFCTFECIYGSSDKEVLLPASASCHTCLKCDPSEIFIEGVRATRITRNSYSTPTMEEKIDTPLRVEIQHKYQVLIKSSSGKDFYIDIKATDKVVDLKTRVSEYAGVDWDSHHLYSRGAILRDQRLLSAYQIGPRSLIEIVALKYVRGCDVTQFRRPNFCSSCLWTQIDVKLAKICMPCRNEKLAIVRHSHHGNWISFFHIVYDADGDGLTTTNKQGNCMICTKLARTKCAGCPLVVCIDCSTHLDAICKGELNLLIYSMAPEHIRNDAFLLRSDGGGF